MIRQALAEDIPAFEDLTRRAYQAYVPGLNRNPTPMDRDYRPVVAAGGLWVDDALRGGIVLEPEGARLVVYSVVVDPLHHGQGIGQALLEHAVMRARTAGVSTLRLCTGATMARNLQIYTSFGFVEVGREDLNLSASPTVVWMEMQV